MNWKESIWFFDVDDTLISTADCTEAAADGIYDALRAAVPEPQAAAVRAAYCKIFALLMTKHRAIGEATLTGEANSPAAADGEADAASREAERRALDKLMERIDACQAGIVEKFGKTRMWSREILVKLAAEDAGVPLRSQAIIAASMGYWKKLATVTAPVPGAVELIEHLNQKKRPVFLLTSSDSRLQFNVLNEFTYDPFYSEIMKRERLAVLERLGFQFSGMTIGDPEDKPSEEFFKKGMNLAASKLGPIPASLCVMVGDSFSRDLLVPLEKMRIGFGILYTKNHAKDIQPNNKLLITGDLAGVRRFI